MWNDCDENGAVGTVFMCLQEEKCALKNRTDTSPDPTTAVANGYAHVLEASHARP